MLTENIILQSGPEEQNKSQVSEKNSDNLSDFELKSLQRVRF